MESKNDQTEVEEIWAPCQFITKDGTLEEYHGYEVSNFGRVKSLNYKHTGKPKVLRHGTYVGSNGTYYQVNLCKDNKQYTRRVHRLVLSSFNPERYFENAVVDHIDSNSSNNRLSNLRWATYQENVGTPHCKALLTNHPSFSKRVKVTFLDNGHYEIFPSTHEVERALGLSCVVSSCILNRNGLYKKLNLLFEYI